MTHAADGLSRIDITAWSRRWFEEHAPATRDDFDLPHMLADFERYLMMHLPRTVEVIHPTDADYTARREELLFELSFIDAILPRTAPVLWHSMSDKPPAYESVLISDPPEPPASSRIPTRMLAHVNHAGEWCRMVNGQSEPIHASRTKWRSWPYPPEIAAPASEPVEQAPDGEPIQQRGLSELIDAADNADWHQVALVHSYGAPCFRYEPSRKRFCLRAKTWHGHGHPSDGHSYVSLADLLASRLRSEPDAGETGARNNDRNIA